MDARDQVVASWENNQLETRLNEQAEILIPQLQSGTDFARLGMSPTVEADQTRTGFVTGTPPSFIEGVFKMAVGDVTVVDSFGTVLVVRLDAINPAGENENVAALREQLAKLWPVTFTISIRVMRSCVLVKILTHGPWLRCMSTFPKV